MIFEIHTHLKNISPCSNITLDQLLLEAKEYMIDGIVITDHDKMTSPEFLKKNL